MAIYHVSHRPIGRSTHAPGAAAAHARYILRRGACSAAVTILPDGITADSLSIQRWFREQEKADRANARMADRLVAALPGELNPPQRLDLVKDFVRALGDGRVPVVAAIHENGDDASNPHVHVLLRDRDLLTGKRILMTSERGSTERFRDLWERCANRALERAGRVERIDRRSYAARGIDRIPTRHRGPRVDAMERKGILTDVAAAARRRDGTAFRIEKELDDAATDLRHATRDHNQRYVSELTSSRSPTITQPGHGMGPDTPPWRRRREEELSRIYGVDLRGHSLARYFRLYHDLSGAVVLDNARAHIVDHGDRITGATGNDTEVRAMLDVAQLHGWRSITVFGTDEFKRRAMDAALSRAVAIVPVTHLDWELLAAVSAARERRSEAHRTEISEQRERLPYDDHELERGGRT
jgi:hypothetical protein